jgi:aminoglycoside 6-adenylyltransferase
MKEMEQTSVVLLHLQQWAENQESVRAMLLTSSRTNTNAKVDIFSDYDVILVVKDIHPFFTDRKWLQDFGEALVTYWDPIHPIPEYGMEIVANVIQYADGLHIDFNLWPIELLRQIVKATRLPNGLDDGYTILVDKDHLTEGMAKPTYQAYIPKPPTEDEYHKVIEDFFSDVPYVVKCLKRDELMPAKWCLDFDMKQNFLRQMLVWQIEIDHNWSAPEGNLGKGLKKKLPLSIWTELENTYAAAGIEENWEALFRMLALFRKVGIGVANHLKFDYPLELDEGVRAYAQKMKYIELITG